MGDLFDLRPPSDRLCVGFSRLRPRCEAPESDIGPADAWGILVMGELSGE